MSKPQHGSMSEQLGHLPIKAGKSFDSAESDMGSEGEDSQRSAGSRDRKSTPEIRLEDGGLLHTSSLGKAYLKLTDEQRADFLATIMRMHKAQADTAEAGARVEAKRVEEVEANIAFKKAQAEHARQQTKTAWIGISLGILGGICTVVGLVAASKSGTKDS